MNGISIITCTNRAAYINNLFRNYDRQKWRKKELIIILNNDNMNIEEYKETASRYKNTFVYRLPEKTSLGKCLNFGVKNARHRFVAKFDDDDYYAPSYLKETMKTFRKTKADIVGKRAHFLWLSGNKVLILRHKGSENKFVKIVPGATLVIKKSVFKRVRFPNINKGEDDIFCRRCRAKGFKIYSGGKYNFAALRRKDSRGHTWIISEKKLLSGRAEIFRKVKNYKKFVSR